MSYNQKKETMEAIQAGERALTSLRCAQSCLSSARSFGVWDIVGGGFLSSMLKRSRMNEAKANVEQAKYDLQRFSKELSDVSMYCDLHIETGDFLSFADWFFDSFLVDWLMQDRIRKAEQQVSEAIGRVEAIVKQLWNSYDVM